LPVRGENAFSTDFRKKKGGSERKGKKKGRDGRTGGEREGNVRANVTGEADEKGRNL